MAVFAHEDCEYSHRDPYEPTRPTQIGLQGLSKIDIPLHGGLDGR